MKAYNLIKKTAVLLVVISFAVLSETLLWADSDITSIEILSEKLIEKTEKIDDIIFEFEQDIFIAGSTDTVKAKVFYKKPGSFFISYTEPVIQEIYFDGEKLITYIPRLRQATSQIKKDAEEMLGISADLIFSPRGLEGLKENHNLNIENIDSEKDSIVLEALPHEKTEYENMFITFDLETLRPVKTVVSAPHTESVTVFKNYKINTGLEKEKFEFQPPEGIEILKID
ncbi:MAG: LolA family protein [Elusimicrobiota bacterium]